MKSKSLKQVITIFAFLAVTASFTSCNRGYGCPTFSVGDIVVQAVKTIPYTIIKL